MSSPEPAPTKKKVSITQFQGVEPVKIELNGPGMPSGTFEMIPPTMEQIEEFRSYIVLSGGALAEHSVVLARQKVFRTNFLSFEFEDDSLELDLEDGQTPRDYFLQAPKVVDSVASRLLAETFPQTNIKKK